MGNCDRGKLRGDGAARDVHRHPIMCRLRYRSGIRGNGLWPGLAVLVAAAILATVDFEPLRVTPIAGP